MPRNPTKSDTDALIGTVYEDIHAERVSVSSTSDSMESRDWDDQKWLPLLMSTLGKAASIFADEDDLDIGELKNELISLAANSAAWIEAIEETMEGQAEEE